MPRYPRSHRPEMPQTKPTSPNREPAGGRTVAKEYNANAGRMDQVLYAADVTGHISGTYIPGNSVAQRLAGVGQTPPRTWVPNGKGFANATAVSKGEWRDTTPAPPASARTDSGFRGSPRSIASSLAGRDGNGVPIPTIRSHESAFSRMPTIRASQSARLAPVTGGGATVGFAEDSREALEAAKNEILALRQQLGLPDELPELPKLQPPATLGRHMPESPGGFTPEPGMPRTAGSAASDAVSLPGSPRVVATPAGSGKHYGSGTPLPMPPPATGRSELSTADSAASSAWSERSALIRANFKPTQQLFEQRFNTPRLILTRGGRTRIVPPRNVTSVTHFVRKGGNAFQKDVTAQPWGHGYNP